MLEPLYETLRVSILGFTLAIIYYLHFSERQPLKENMREGPVMRCITRFIDSKMGAALAIPGLVLLVLITPGIALDGMIAIYLRLLSYGLSEAMAQLIAGIWIEVAIIGGWLAEYAMQRESRNLPAIRFSLR